MNLQPRLSTDLGDYGLRRAIFAKMSLQEQNTSWSLFAGAEELVDKVLLILDVPSQKIRYEQIRQRMFAAKRKRHCFFVNLQKFAVHHLRSQSHCVKNIQPEHRLRDLKAVEDSYGHDVLTLTVCCGFVRRILANPRVDRHLSSDHPEILEAIAL